MPFKPNALLQKIPRNVQENRNDEANNIEGAWTDVFVNHLESLSMPTTPAAKIGKKVNIVAGKSVSTADLIVTLIDKAPKNSKPKNQNTKRSQESDISDEDDISISSNNRIGQWH